MAETVGQRIRRLRLAAGLSQRDLQAPGVSYAYISRIEAGSRQPSVKALRKLADRLDVSAIYLETGQDAIEVLVETAAVDAHAARCGADLTWADLTVAERSQVTQGLTEALTARIGVAVYAASINRPPTRRGDRMTGIGDDPFPLIEETTDPHDLPTVSDWLLAGGPMRELEAPCGHDGWVEGCPNCERQEKLAREAMGDAPDLSDDTVLGHCPSR